MVQIAENVQWLEEVLPIGNGMEMEVDGESKAQKLRKTLFLHQKECSVELWYLDGVHPMKVMDIKVGLSAYNILCSSIFGRRIPERLRMRIISYTSCSKI